jgi:hypothetical protein
VSAWMDQQPSKHFFFIIAPSSFAIRLRLRGGLRLCDVRIASLRLFDCCARSSRYRLALSSSLAPRRNQLSDRERGGEENSLRHDARLPLFTFIFMCSSASSSSSSILSLSPRMPRTKRASAIYVGDGHTSSHEKE